MIETRLLHNALTLAEYRNFARAAKRLNISQPTLTRSIQVLEMNIGTRLFDRKARTVLPTPVGEELLKHARLIVSTTLALEDGIQQFMGLEKGELAIGAGLYAASSLLGPAIGRFKVQHPNIRIKIEVDDWLTLRDRLKQADFDFVLAESSGLDREQGLEVTNLNPHQAFFFCRSGHPLLKETSLSPGDLIRFPLILPTLPERILKLFRRLFRRTGEDLQSIEQRSMIQCNDMSVMKHSVAHSDVIGIATFGTLHEELKRKRFAALPLRIPELKSNYGILRRSGLSLSPAAAAFAGMIVEIDATLSEQETPLVESLS